MRRCWAVGRQEDGEVKAEEGASWEGRVSCFGEEEAVSLAQQPSMSPRPCQRQCELLTSLAINVEGDSGVPSVSVLVVAGGDGEHAVAALGHGDGQGAHHVAQAAGLAAGGGRRGVWGAQGWRVAAWEEGGEQRCGACVRNGRERLCKRVAACCLLPPQRVCGRREGRQFKLPLAREPPAHLQGDTSADTNTCTRQNTERLECERALPQGAQPCRAGALLGEQQPPRPAAAGSPLPLPAPPNYYR